MFGGKPALGYNFTGRRSQNLSTTAQTDVVEFTLTNNRIPILAGTGTVEVISSTINDSANGTGVRTVEIIYLDQNYDLQQTSVTLNGILAVTVQKNGVNITPQGIWWMHTLTHGSNSAADGNITLRLTSGSAPIEMIAAGGNMSLSARCVVPRGYTGFLSYFYGSAATGNQDIRLRATVSKLGRSLLDSVYCFQSTMNPKEGVAIERQLPYLVVPERTRIKVSTISSVAAGLLDSSFTLLLVKN